MIDNYRHKGLRHKLVLEVQAKGIKEQKVLQALDSVPRHFFLDKSFLIHAYEDKAFQIGEGQTISQPYTVAFQSELLDVDKGLKILEVGTGSGYQSCVLAEMGAKVFSIERQKKLHDDAEKLIKKLGYHVKCFFGDGYKGLPSFAPFDRIIVTCGTDHIPPVLLSQLKEGGKMVIPVGYLSGQTMKLIIKEKSGIIEKNYGDFQFVPMLQNTRKTT